MKDARRDSRSVHVIRRAGTALVCVALAVTGGSLLASRRAGALRTTAPAAAAGARPAGATLSTACTNASVLAGWSNERLAMMTIGVPVEETTPSEVESEVADGAGGVLLFGTSAPSNLGSMLTQLRDRVPGHLGLLVMTDEEGGGVQRMANLVGNLPWARTMGDDWTPDHIERAVRRVAEKMKAAGVNMDLAPVVDVDGRDVYPGASDPDGYRSFSGTTSVVERDGLAYAKGLIRGHVIPVLKHFPGLGGVSGNTDDGPAHTIPWSEEQTRGLPPFTAGIAAHLPAIMTSNATVPGLASYPASLSPAATGRELESTLGFHGFVITDSLTAGAITDAGWTVPEAAVQALVAGADMVIFSFPSNTTVSSETSQMASAIVAAVGRRTLARSRLIAAAGAVLAVRHKSLCG